MPHCIYCHCLDGLVHTDLGPVCTGPECSDRLDGDLFQLEMVDTFEPSDGLYQESSVSI